MSPDFGSRRLGFESDKNKNGHYKLPEHNKQGPRLSVYSVYGACRVNGTQCGSSSFKIY